MKILSVCIPTYKRPKTLRRCIDSVARQIDAYGLSEIVEIYVTDDASPDDTADVLSDFQGQPFFRGVTRAVNLGMNQNIKKMLREAADFSDYQLIITDDDYLQPEVLNDIVGFLRRRQDEGDPVPLIWTPRYSYTEDDALHTVICNPYDLDTRVEPSVYQAGKLMFNGFILSGLILRSSRIDYEFWNNYGENAYFPILFFGDLLMREGAFYWNRNITHHTVLNECHWERWGKNEAVIDMRLFSDFANAFGIMRKHIDGKFDSFRFYLATFPSVYRLVNGRLASGKLNQDRSQIFAAVDELRQKGLMTFELPIRLQILSALALAASISALKLIVTRLTLLVAKDSSRKERYFRRIRGNLDLLVAGSVLAKSVFR